MTLADRSHAPLLVGRDDELATLRGLLDSACSGGRQAAVVSGEAGIGKTTLLEQLAVLAEQQGVRVVRGHCYDLTASTAYSLWADLARELRAVEGLPPFPAVLLEPGAVERPASRAQLFDDVTSVLLQLATQSPTLYILEDLHWADPSSLDLLRVAMQRLRNEPVLLVLSYRSDDLTRRTPLYQALPQLVRESQAQRLELRRFGASEVRDYIAAN